MRLRRSVGSMRVEPRHYALLPCLDDDVSSWFWLGFGSQQAHGIKEVEPQAWPPGTRRAGPGDIDALLELVPLVSDFHALAPVFSGIELRENEAALRAMLSADLANEGLGQIVYERDGNVVASFEIVPVRAARCMGLSR